MGFWDLIFGANKTTKPTNPTIKFGRYTDSYKSKAQYEAWDLSLSQFDDEDYLTAYETFLKYLRDDKMDNVRWLAENGSIRFEILQGSKRVNGIATAHGVKAEARIAQAKELSVAFMRRLMELNHSLDYSRYALDDDNNLVIKFETSALDGSPYKLYYALKEVAVNADKLDDLLLDEFNVHLTPIDMGSKMDLPAPECEVKYQFIQSEINRIFDEMDKGSLNAEAYPSGISYLLLSTAYKLDFLTLPEGFMMETIERIHRLYFDNSERTLIQKNVSIRKEFDKIRQRSKSQFFSELYGTSSTFGIMVPKGHDTLVSLIDGELPNMDWYEQNNHTAIAKAVPDYIVGTALFNYALPKPDHELLGLYYRITEPQYFADLGFDPVYFDKTSLKFDNKGIKNAIRSIVDSHKENFLTLSPDLNILDFSSLTKFARTYLLMLRQLDVTPKGR